MKPPVTSTARLAALRGVSGSTIVLSAFILIACATPAFAQGGTDLASGLIGKLQTIVSANIMPWMVLVGGVIGGGVACGMLGVSRAVPGLIVGATIGLGAAALMPYLKQ